MIGSVVLFGLLWVKNVGPLRDSIAGKAFEFDFDL